MSKNTLKNRVRQLEERMIRQTLQPNTEASKISELLKEYEELREKQYAGLTPRQRAKSDFELAAQVADELQAEGFLSSKASPFKGDTARHLS